MISDHLQATRELEDSLRHLKEIITQLPECKDKYRLEARIEVMQDTVQDYISKSANLYDQLSILTYYK